MSRYDEVFFEGVEDAFAASGRRARTRREQALDERRLAQVIPDAAFRRQLQVRCFFLWGFVGEFADPGVCLC
jgi:hypothetical protein